MTFQENIFFSFQGIPFAKVNINCRPRFNVDRFLTRTSVQKHRFKVVRLYFPGAHQPNFKGLIL